MISIPSPPMSRGFRKRAPLPRLPNNEPGAASRHHRFRALAVIVASPNAGASLAVSVDRHCCVVRRSREKPGPWCPLQEAGRLLPPLSIRSQPGPQTSPSFPLISLRTTLPLVLLLRNPLNPGFHPVPPPTSSVDKTQLISSLPYPFALLCFGGTVPAMLRLSIPEIAPMLFAVAVLIPLPLL
ncbi:hypothetical protein FHG87_001452 [Trinorchestia longiramus]|nr:hypothetical protein FHG87_001452 [Trinorchestia longiramus]